jgi:hypothetical protein
VFDASVRTGPSAEGLCPVLARPSFRLTSEGMPRKGVGRWIGCRNSLAFLTVSRIFPFGINDPRSFHRGMESEPRSAVAVDMRVGKIEAGEEFSGFPYFHCIAWSVIRQEITKNAHRQHS